MKPKLPSFDQVLYERSLNCIAHGSLTNSKRPQSFVKGIYPTHLKRGSGCFVYDTNDNFYIDFISGLGTSLLGYGNDQITEAISRQWMRGNCVSLGTQIEIECAEKLKEVFPLMERMRFLKTGSEACTAAVRIARAFTKRNCVFSEGYHGWSDEFVSLTPPAHGVTGLFDMRSLEFLDTFQDLDHVAAVIVEPIITDHSQRRIAWLHELRKKCTAIGALLIFDETITGLRFQKYCVAQEYGIIPDILILGKAIGGGFALSVVGGREEVMNTDYFVSSTFAGETIPLASCVRLIELLQKGEYKLDYLWEKGIHFKTRFNAIWPEGISLDGYPTRSVLKGSELNQAIFMQECCKAGILIGTTFFFNFSHIDVIEQSLSIFTDILYRIKTGCVTLEGEMPVKPFAAKLREDK